MNSIFISFIFKSLGKRLDEVGGQEAAPQLEKQHLNLQLIKILLAIEFPIHQDRRKIESI